MNVTLFGDLGRNFNAEQVFKQGQKVPVVAIFAGMLVEGYKGLIYTLSYFFNCIISSFPYFSNLISPSCYLEIRFIVRSTSASKYYLDLDVEEVQKFRARCGLTELNHLYLSRNADQGYIRPELIVLCVCSLDGPHKPIDRLPCRLQKPVKRTELVDSWQTIKQLTSLTAYELQVRWRRLIRFKPYVLLTYLSLFLYSSVPGCAEPP